MSKICSNCNYINNDQNKFCEQCGNTLINPEPIEQKEQYKTASLVWGIVSIFLGFITSIIGIVYGIKYRGKYNKVCGGYILSLITFIFKLFVYPIIIYSILIFILPFLVLNS